MCKQVQLCIEADDQLEKMEVNDFHVHEPVNYAYDVPIVNVSIFNFTLHSNNVNLIS